MDRAQRNYAMGRIEDLYHSARYQLEEKHLTPAVRLSYAQKLTAFKRGEYKFVKGVKEISNYTKVQDVITFDAESPKKFNEAAYERDARKLKAEADSIKDQIMLGDALEALTLIEKFAKKLDK